MRKNRICLNAVSQKIPDSLSEDRLMFSSAGAQPISLKSFRGLGHFPNKIARVYKHEHCLPSAFRSWQVMRSGYRRALLAGMASSGVGTHRICLLFCKKIPVVPRRFSQVYIHLLCLLFSVSHVSKRHFLNWKSAATAALSAKKRNGRTEVNGGAALLFSGADAPPLTPPEGAVCP